MAVRILNVSFGGKSFTFERDTFMNTTKIKNVNLVVTKFLRQKIINVKLLSNYLVQLDLRRITSTHFMNMKATKITKCKS